MNTIITFSYWNELAFIICSLIGGMMHYTKKFLRKETDASMFQWFGKKNWVASVYTIVMFIFVTIGALAGGIINEKTDFWAILYTGFVTGFAVDAGFNSDKSITAEINTVKSETQELFKKDPVDEVIEKPRASARVTQIAPGLALAEFEQPAPQKRRRTSPIEGSPKVPPKRIT